MKIFACVPLLVLLSACQTTNPTPIETTVSGARYATSEFDCGAEPAPPNPKTIAPKRGGRAMVRADAAVRTWGRGCQNKLTAVGRKATDAGQVVDANGNAAQ